LGYLLFNLGKSWVPFENIEGTFIPHGEAITIGTFLSDQETGYAPSQYYVYSINPYAKTFVDNMPPDSNLQNCNPDMEVIHPSKYHIKGYDRVGALLICNKNRGWWSGTIMDEVDSSVHFNGKFGPTVLQVAAGVYSGFLWLLKNPNVGCKYAEELDTDFIFKYAEPYLGRVYSNYVDLTKTCVKDCYKFDSFIVRKPEYKKK
jgi:homospermidine synthase